MNPKKLIGLGVFASFVAVLLFSFGSSVGGYMDFTEAEQTGASAHIVGYWVEDMPVAYDPQQNVFSFHMRDEAGIVRKVNYPNPKPANFEDAEKLVIEGKAEGDVFLANHILVKCPSKYNETQALEPTAAS